MDVRDILCKFLYEKNKDKESWFAGINALYSDTNENLDGSKISEITMDWIGKKSKILAANLELINNEYEIDTKDLKAEEWYMLGFKRNWEDDGSGSYNQCWFELVETSLTC